MSQGYENRVGGLSKEPAETRQREKGDRQSTGQVERGRGKASLPGREKDLEERARAKRQGQLQRRESKTEGWRQREWEGEGDSQTVKEGWQRTRLPG